MQSRVSDPNRELSVFDPKEGMQAINVKMKAINAKEAKEAKLRHPVQVAATRFVSSRRSSPRRSRSSSRRRAHIDPGFRPHSSSPRSQSQSYS